MRIYNADGSVAEMCGNGIRGFAKFVLDRGLVRARPAARRDRRRHQDRRARAGRRARGPRRGRHGRAGVGRALRSRSTRTVRSSSARSRSTATSTGVTCVSMGNPHCVVFLDDVASLPLATLGPALRAPPLLPAAREHRVHPRRRTRATCEMRVWERGAGETARLRHRRLRRGGGGGAHRHAPAGTCVVRAARRRARHRLARRRPRPHDRRRGRGLRRLDRGVIMWRRLSDGARDPVPGRRDRRRRARAAGRRADRGRRAGRRALRLDGRVGHADARRAHPRWWKRWCAARADASRSSPARARTRPPRRSDSRARPRRRARPARS